MWMHVEAKKVHTRNTWPGRIYKTDTRLLVLCRLMRSEFDAHMLRAMMESI